MFTDRARVKFIAGKGGNGIVAWRREKYIPKGGPTGGNGGRGGSVILQADIQVPSLDSFRNRRLLRADNGREGGPNRQMGRNGKDLILKVPCGTLVKDVESGEILCDLTETGHRFQLCEGGIGGRGNDSFKTATNQTPRKCTMGTPGQECSVELELKLIADVGFVGFPNAGKSTLHTAFTRAYAKAAAYPFTTLRPNLSFVQFDDYSRVYFADIPGIIEGAHENKGLGLEFLRHVERSEILLFVVDAAGVDGRNPLEDYRVLRNEIRDYSSEVAEKPFVVALNKVDCPEAEENIELFKNESGLPMEQVFVISAQEGEGVQALLEGTRKLAQVKGKRF